MRLLKAVSVVALCGLMAAAGHAQNRAGAPPQFRTGVDLLQMDVSVLDRNGSPIRGLSASDFTVFEDGIARPIAAFNAIDIPDRVVSGASWVRDVAPDIASNHADARRVVVIVLDDFHVPLDAAKVTKQIATAVVDHLGPSDLCAVVFTLARKSGQEFTSDRQRLLAAIERFVPSGISPVSRSRFSASEPNRPSTAFGGPLPGGACITADCLTQAMENAGKALSGWTGVRKTLVLVGPGMSLPPDLLTDSPLPLRGIAAAFAALQESNVSVYQFDPRGLEVGRHPDEDIDLFSDATGGRAIHDTNTPWEMVPQVFRENSSYYLLGIAPAAPRHDGRFHRITVKVNHPDAQIRTRAGYFDRADAPSRRGDTNALDRAIEGALPAGEVPVTLTAVPFANPEKKGGSLVVVAGVEGGAPGSSPLVLDVEAAAFHDNWKPAGMIKQTVQVGTNAAAPGPAHADIGSRLDLSPGRYEIRVAVRDRATDRVGSAQISAVLPDFGNAPLEVSGLVLERGRPSPATGPVAALVSSVPTTIRLFSRTERLSARMRVYQGTARSGPLRAVRIHARVQNAGGEISLDREVAVEPAAFSNHAAEWSMALPLADLAPGEYLLSVDAAAGDRVVRRDARFTVTR